MEKRNQSPSENQIPAFWRCSSIRGQIHAYFCIGPLNDIFGARRTSCSRRCMGVGLSILYSDGYKILLDKVGAVGKRSLRL